MRHLRNHQNTDGKENIEKAINRLAILLKEAQDSATLDELRGYEGICADEYFSVFDHMIVAQKNDFRFLKRSRRPPLDRVNALLSFLYVLLAHACRSALESVGLDPAVGFLHRDRPGRPSLALDLLEEFRHPIADRLVLSLINLQTVQAKDFIIGPTGAVEMSDDTRKTILQTWQKRKLDEVQHPYLEETISLGLFFHVQAQLLARTIRGDMKYYPAYMNR
jgi:CRISPR-associated protein Cas1